jgi:MoxR-like ATPase
LSQDLATLREEVEQQSALLRRLQSEIGQVIVGQSDVVEKILVGMLASGHILLEGLPGLAKTLTFRTLAAAVSASFQRVQFTPDLLPADLVGTNIFNPQTASFSVKKGPLFANLVLADEINRAPAKVQSALLEAMQERQVTLGDTTHSLPEPFLVLATQNPIEQEGTYPLPEAQVDRFMLKVRVDYPSREEESLIIDRMTGDKLPSAQAVLTTDQLLSMRSLLPKIYLDPRVKNYILDLVFSTREPEKFRMPHLKGMISCGASPRASLALAQAARAYAFLRGRAHATPDDVKSIGMDVLRHRVQPSYEAEAEDKTSETLLRDIFDRVEVP